MVLSTLVLGAHMLMQTAAFQLSIPGLAKAPTADTTLVKVNGVAIKAKDIEDLLWDTRSEEILNEVMLYQITKTEADKLGLIVTQAEIDKEMERTMDQIKQNLAPGQTVEGAMAQDGQTKSRLYLGVKSSLYLSKIALKDFEPKEYVRISTILVKTKTKNASDIAATIQVVQKAYDRIKAGEPWAKLVDELIVDQTAKQSRGLVGWRKISIFPDDVKAELTVLKKGEVTKPVQTDNGIQIFRIDERGDSLSKEGLDQMKQELMRPLQDEAARKMRLNLKIERLYPPQKSGS